ncbi:MAG TPA: ABC transporter permease [Armatimonadota bacterium]|nr:ABC transporter permease [Armatimonadota bacterium]
MAQSNTITQPGSPDLPGRPTPRDTMRSAGRMAGPFLGLALVLLLFSIKPDVRSSFLAVGNFRIVAAQTVIVALGALGMTIIMISGGIDLSVGSVIALTCVIAALMIKAGQPAIVALCVAALSGGVVGAINGSLIAGLRVTPFIVTLGTLGVARGAAKWLAQEQTINPPSSALNNLAATQPVPSWLLVSPGVWITLALAILTAILLRYTLLGRYIFAIGSNEIASRLGGLRVDALKIGIYALGGLFFGLAGALQYGRLGMGDPTVAVGAELDIIAAVVIGGGSLSGGEGSVLGSILGALIMSFLRNGSQQMGWPAYVEEMIIGAVIVAAVALDQIRHRGRKG